jgi:cell wall-associated NlpC family hydrolase
LKRLALPGALLLALASASDLSAQAASPRPTARRPGQLLSAARGDSASAATPAMALVRGTPAASLAIVGTAPGPAGPSVAASTDAPATLRDSIVALARAQLGTRYLFGGTTPERGFDCSGLIRYIAQALHLDVPRTANEQSRVGSAIARDMSRLRPGDLLTFGTGSRISHIGIYVGDGKFIHASTVAGRVVEARVDRKPGRGIKPWLGVRRLLADADSAVRGG